MTEPRSSRRGRWGAAIAALIIAAGAVYVRARRARARESDELHYLASCLDENASTRPIEQRYTAVWIVGKRMKDKTRDDAFMEFIGRDPEAFASSVDIGDIAEAARRQFPYTPKDELDSLRRAPHKAFHPLILKAARAHFDETVRASEELLGACGYDTSHWRLFHP